MRKQIIITVAGILIVTMAGCISATDPNKKTKEGAAIGAAAGAVVGAIVGNQSGNPATGAVVGGAVGAGVGTAVGYRMDKQQAELERVAGIEVARTANDEIEVTLKNDILYDVDSSTLRSSSRTTLSEMAGVLTKYPDTAIQVSGHADSTGTESHNQILSTQRAKAVSSYLALQGVAGSRIESIGYGEMYPRGTNDTSEGRQLNRRVEIKIKAEAQ